MYLSVNNDGVIKSISAHPLAVTSAQTIKTPEITEQNKKDFLGKRVLLGERKPLSKIAYVCNWAEHCGISSYSQALISHIQKIVPNVKIFSEIVPNPPDEANVVYSWQRGNSMIETIENVLAWQPDIVHIQHEFGIFPKATHFLKMLEMLDSTPYAVTTHSVYEHLDKTICTSCIKNIIAHSDECKKLLLRLGHLNTIHVVKHGCLVYPDTTELWNIFQTEYAIIQFGFGFNYKGVDMAIDAIAYLKKDEKFKNIFYCYLCSENEYTYSIHSEYYSYLKKKVLESHLQENVVILRGFLSEKVISNFLRTARLAIFPYKTDPNNCVYGASGAIRHAMANGVPVIASDSHLFDDLEGIVPRTNNYLTLALEIDKIFSNQNYKQKLVQKNLRFVQDNNWDVIAQTHIDVYNNIITEHEKKSVRIQDFELIPS